MGRIEKAFAMNRYASCTETPARMRTVRCLRGCSALLCAALSWGPVAASAGDTYSCGFAMWCLPTDVCSETSGSVVFDVGQDDIVVDEVLAGDTATGPRYPARINRGHAGHEVRYTDLTGARLLRISGDGATVWHVLDGEGHSLGFGQGHCEKQ